jgi:hypothetical protein
MKRENNNPRFVYPMSMLNKMFTPEEVEKMSERDFNESDEFFHFDEDEGWIESFNEEDFKFYNSAMPTDKILLKVA